MSRSLEGVVDNLRSDQLVDGVTTQNISIKGLQSSHGIQVDDSDDEHFASSVLPGTSSGGDGSRSTRPDIRTNAISFSPTGREWAAATTQGLQVYLNRKILMIDYLIFFHIMGLHRFLGWMML